MNKLFQIIYVSSSTEILEEHKLEEMLASFRANNIAHGITGMLLYQDGCIMQVIEGAQDAIEQLFSRIEADDRHKGIILLMKEPIEARDFADWSMSFHNLTGVGVQGFSDFLLRGSFESDSHSASTKAKKLLLSFRR